MNSVRFPSINLEFCFSKIAFTIFGIAIYKYAVCIVVGIIVGLIVCKLNEGKFDIPFEKVLEKIVLTIVVGIVGARLYYVIFKLDYYSQNPLEIINLRDGGLAIYGALIGGTIYLIYSLKDRKRKLDFLDYIIPSVAIAQSIGRWGNFFNVEAYGYETSNFFRMGIDSINGYIEVHPTFLYESIATFLIFIILEILQNKRKFEGQVFFTYCLLYSFVRMIIENLRADSLYLFDFRISQVVSLIIFIISIVEIVKLSRKKSYEKWGKY